jgi:hypothetical protein
MTKIENVLNQEKSENSDLKNQYEELSKNKANLDIKLQAVLQEKAAAVAALQAQGQPTAPNK